jgi:hypothetical protein
MGNIILGLHTALTRLAHLNSLLRMCVMLPLSLPPAVYDVRWSGGASPPRLTERATRRDAGRDACELDWYAEPESRMRREPRSVLTCEGCPTPEPWWASGRRISYRQIMGVDALLAWYVLSKFDDTATEHMYGC